MKITSSAQLKAKIKNLAVSRGVDPRVLLRIYMMERFLDRVSHSCYRESFVLKGGMLISYLIGVNLRTTMDIDTTMQNTPLNPDAINAFIEEILAVDVNDGITFNLSSIDEIMDEADYPGLRVALLAQFDGTSTPVKIDISTGDAITPAATLTKLEVMFADPIAILVYPTETVIAEKLQTVVTRSTFNTRMRDFYDLHALSELSRSQISQSTLESAITATFLQRKSTTQLGQWREVLQAIESDDHMATLWQAYRSRYDWATSLGWHEVITAARSLFILARV